MNKFLLCALASAFAATALATVARTNPEPCAAAPSGAAYRAQVTFWRAPYAAAKTFRAREGRPTDTDVFTPTNRIAGLVLVEARVSGRALEPGPHPYNGPKVMLVYTSRGRQHYPQVAADYGTFGPTVWKMVHRLPDDAGNLKVVVGIENARGELTVESVTISSAVETSPEIGEPKPTPVDMSLPRGRWLGGHNPSARRGVMSGNDLSDSALDYLVRWKANLMRCQIRIRQGDCERPSDYFAALQSELNRCHDVLDRCAARGIKVIVDLHSGPGCRQTKVLSNEIPEDYDAANLCRAWRMIASRFVGHPAVWAYDILNEPHATPTTWDRVFRQVMKAIRPIDARTPCVTEFPDFWYADENVIYSPHVYSPLELTHFGVGTTGSVRWDYPGEVNGRLWDRERLRQSLAPWIRLQAAHPEARICVGEFSCVLWTRGAARYLSDAIDIFEEYGWDWTYHAFREWPGWDVERMPDIELTPGVTRKATVPPDRQRVLLQGFSANVRENGVPALLPVRLEEKADGKVCLRVTLVADDAESAKGWTLLSAPKRISRFKELTPGASFESPFGSGKMVSVRSHGATSLVGSTAVWEIPMSQDSSFTPVVVFRAWKGTNGTEAVEASVARLARQAGNVRLLKRAEKAFGEQGTEPIPCNEDLRIGNERVYRMKRTGTEVFEVDLQAVTPLSRPVSILAWGDNHFKLADASDRANDNIAAAFKKRGTCNPPELTCQSAQREVEMTPYFDKTVVLGDFIDFFSTGSLSLWKQMVLDPVGSDLLTVIGAHDVRTDFINGRPYMEMPPEKTLPVVSGFLPNDPYYSSELIGDKVLAVCIWSDWGWFVDYWNVAEKFRKDLDRARQNGWTVVLFGHDGFYPNTWTKGPDGKYDREADKLACLMKGFCLSGDNARKRESYANRGDYLTGAKDRGEHVRKGTKAFYDVLYSGGDVIRGIFQGHVHANYCMRVRAHAPDGKPVDIPQYSCRGSAFCPDGFVFKINVK